MAELLERLRVDLAGRYGVERELGRGGMATVFLARDLRLHRPVALKLLHPDLAAAVGTRFLREIEIIAGLSHPHILALHEAGEAANSLFYVMPVVDGESLRDCLLRERQLSVADAIRIARDVADALAYAHAHGIVHRDIKPDNILLSASHAIVADFGIARAFTAAGGPLLTSAGLAIGTPAYMSPEQATGGASVDGRADIYGLGCVVYEMLAGAPPFLAPTPQAVLARHITDPVPPLRTVRPSVSPALEHVIMKALEKVPADRYPTATAFSAALDGAGVRASAPEPRRRAIWRPSRRAALLVTGGALLALAAAVWRLGIAHSPALDAHRVVVFPTTVGAGEQATLGEDVATALAAALNSTRFIKAVDGWRLLVDAARDEPDRVSARTARSLAVAQHAAFYLVGRIVLGDSARLVVELHDVQADSTVQRTLAFPRAGDSWAMGVAAARDLLPALVGAGQRIDITALGTPSPAAATAYLMGQRAYRRGHFDEALGHFREAVAEDSSFALAAVMGASAAGWGRRKAEATVLARLALRHQRVMAPRYTAFVRGLAAYWANLADSAAAHLQTALRMDPNWAEAWAELGEVYSHRLPRKGPADSLQQVAFATAHRLDPSFVPAIYHLIEIAARTGAVDEAERLMASYRRAQPDSTDLLGPDLMLRCVRSSPETVDWRAEVHRHAAAVWDVGGALAVAGLRQPACAEAAWSAILAHDTASSASALQRRYRSLLGLQNLLAAEGRYEEVRNLLASEKRVPRQSLWELYVLNAAAGAPFEREAAVAADSLSAALKGDPAGAASARWYVGFWAAHRRDGVTAGALAEAALRVGLRTPQDSLLAEGLAAWAALARADTGQALERLAALAPVADDTPWESQGAELVRLAELLVVRREYAPAIRAAEGIDAPGSIRSLLYLPASLSVRARAARALGDRRAAARFERRLAALGRNSRDGRTP